MAADIYWPADLPQMPRRGTYGNELANNTTRTEMEYGSAKARRRTSANMRTLSVSYILREKKCPASDVNQKTLFLQFYEVVDCTASFWLPDPENPSQYIKVRIAGSGDQAGPKLSPYAFQVWELPLTLEVWPYAVQPRA